MNSSIFAAPILLGVFAALMFRFVAVRIPIPTRLFDSLPQMDKELLLGAWGSLRTEYSGRMLLHAVRSPEAGVRQMAAFHLEGRCDQASGMLELVKERSGYTPGLISALGKCGHQEAIPTLIDVLKDLSAPGPAGVAAEALGELKAIAAIPALRVATNCSDAVCATHSAQALIILGDQAFVLEWARKRLQQGPITTRSEAMWSAIEIVGAYGDSTDIQILADVPDNLRSSRVESALTRIRSRNQR